MKKLIWVLIIILTVSSLAFSQFVLEPPVIEFDVDFGADSIGILHYYGYRVSEENFWLDVISGSVFHNLIYPSETLIPRSYREVDDNTALDDFIKSTMRRNNITVCITLFPNDFDGYTYIINYSFDKFNKFGFISMDSTMYDASSARTDTATTKMQKYTIVTGRAFFNNITQDELRKRINLQGYNEIVSWLRWGSDNVIETSGVQFDNLINVLVNNFKIERSAAENTVRNIGNNALYQWLTNSSGRITDWIVYYEEG